MDGDATTTLCNLWHWLSLWRKSFSLHPVWTACLYYTIYANCASPYCHSPLQRALVPSSHCCPYVFGGCCRVHPEATWRKLQVEQALVPQPHQGLWPPWSPCWLPSADGPLGPLQVFLTKLLSRLATPHITACICKGFFFYKGRNLSSLNFIRSPLAHSSCPSRCLLIAALPSNRRDSPSLLSPAHLIRVHSDNALHVTDRHFKQERSQNTLMQCSSCYQPLGNYVWLITNPLSLTIQPVFLMYLVVHLSSPWHPNLDITPWCQKLCWSQGKLNTVLLLTNPVILSLKAIRLVRHDLPYINSCMHFLSRDKKNFPIGFTKWLTPKWH